MKCISIFLFSRGRGVRRRLYHGTGREAGDRAVHLHLPGFQLERHHPRRGQWPGLRRRYTIRRRFESRGSLADQSPRPPLPEPLRHAAPAHGPADLQHAVPGLCRSGHGRAGSAEFQHHYRKPGGHPHHPASPHRRCLRWRSPGGGRYRPQPRAHLEPYSRQPTTRLQMWWWASRTSPAPPCRATLRMPSPCADRRVCGFRTANSMSPTRRTTAC